MVSVIVAVPTEINPKGELFAMSERPLTSERQAMTDVSFSSARAWRVVNTHETNTLGQYTGYTLVPGSAAPAFSRAESAPVRTAGFIPPLSHPATRASAAGARGR